MLSTNFCLGGEELYEIKIKNVIMSLSNYQNTIIITLGLIKSKI